tara:strand:+ start:110 stop:1966 length:1857 start_codon:yes stop_codon:yes gene_type:complete
MVTKTEILSKLADQHEQRIVNVLYDLEDDIINSLQAASGGQKLTTQLAIQLRPNLKRLIEENYLKEGDLLIRDYDKVINNYQSFIKNVPIADRFKTLTKPDLAVINQLKQLSFSGFEDVANRFLTTISDEVYKSAIVGKPFPDMVKAIRGEINGVYQRSNENAINRLVDIVDKNKFSDSAISKKLTADATRILHTKYASDRVGRNMRMYASQQAHDSIMQFDAQFTKYKAEEAGITSFKYTGTNIITTRDFCRARVGNVYTEEEARSIWAANWKGKSGSDPFIDRGGYRCRHSFIPYDPAWDLEDDVDIKEEKPNKGFGKNGLEEKNLTESFKDIKDDSNNAIVKAITFLPPLKKYIDNTAKSYYRKSNDTLSISVYHKTPERFPEVYRHEYGHRIDDSIIGKLGETQRKKFKEKLRKIGGIEEGKEIYETVVIDFQQVTSSYSSQKVLNDRIRLKKQKKINDNKLFNLRNEAPAFPKEFDKYLDDVLAKNPEFPLTKAEMLKLSYTDNPKKVLSLIARTEYRNIESHMDDFMDYIGAITNEGLGFGHGKAYYAKFPRIRRGAGMVVTEGHTSEAFANFVSLTSNKEFGTSYLKLMRYYAPETTESFEKILKEIKDIL